MGRLSEQIGKNMQNNLISISDVEVWEKRYQNKFTEYDMAQASMGAYLSDWEDFCLWCRDHSRYFMPADPCDVADYLEDRALNKWQGISGKDRKIQTKEPLKWNSLLRRLTSISKAHQYNEKTFNRKDSAITRTLKGIKNKLSQDEPHRVYEKRRSPICKTDIACMLNVLPNNIRGTRDKAILLIGFTCALRRSEISSIQLHDLESSENGFKLNIPWSKTGQRTTIIPYGSNPSTCPVRALKSWISSSNITEGPLFRGIFKNGKIRDCALSDKAIEVIIKRNPYIIGRLNQAAEKAKDDPTFPIPNFGGHSLRAGFVTQSYLNGATEVNIMAQTGHKKSDTLKKYIRELDEWKNNAAINLGL
jgi:integrase